MIHPLKISIFQLYQEWKLQRFQPWASILAHLLVNHTQVPLCWWGTFPEPPACNFAIFNSTKNFEYNLTRPGHQLNSGNQTRSPKVPQPPNYTTCQPPMYPSVHQPWYWEDILVLGGPRERRSGDKLVTTLVTTFISISWFAWTKIDIIFSGETLFSQDRGQMMGGLEFKALWRGHLTTVRLPPSYRICLVHIDSFS